MREAAPDRLWAGGRPLRERSSCGAAIRLSEPGGGGVFALAHQWMGTACRRDWLFLAVDLVSDTLGKR